MVNGQWLMVNETNNPGSGAAPPESVIPLPWRGARRAGWSPPLYAVIVAGGQGTRMGNAVPKQFLELEGKPILAHTIDAFLEAAPGIKLVLVLPKQQLSWAQMVLTSFPERIDLELVAGGATRFESVQAGLAAVPNEALVLVHDGVRALVSPDLIRHCIEAALLEGSAVPVVPVTDSIREVGEGSSKPLDRSKLRAVQTPQAFGAGELKAAFARPFQDYFTDEATVWESAGKPLHLIAGERGNIKITTPEDLVLAGALLREREG